MARTLRGEVHGEPEEGQIAVAWVIRNRFEATKKWYSAPSIAGVCQKKAQFSCWNMNDPQRKAIEAAGIGELERYFNIALRVLLNQTLDPVRGATHYHADYIKTPAWAVSHKPLRTIGRHLFYKGID